MEKLRIGDACNILNGYAFKSDSYVNEGIRVIRIANVQKGYIEDNSPVYYSIDSGGLDKYMLEEGDLLMSLTGNVGRVALLQKEMLPAALNQRVACLRIKTDRITKEFLFHMLNNDFFEQQCIQASNGVAQKNISTEWLKDYEIPLYTIEEQLKISAVLDKIRHIIMLRNNELRALDELIRARFIELFGDPKSNPMKWRRMTLKQAGIRLSDGPFGSNLKSDHYTNEGVRVIRLGNIGVGKFIDNDKSFVSYEHYKMIEKYTCRAGEIVIGTLGDPNLRACIVPENIEFAINKADCVHYIPKAELLNNYFICQYINCPETLLLASAMIHGQTRARISSGQLAELPIYIPPMELQDQFAAFVAQIDKSKVAVQKALDQTQLLFDSLMQEYFG